MTESQSRYGIMDELNNKKIDAKKKLAELERVKDEKEYNFGMQQDRYNQIVSTREESYVADHKTFVREKKVEKEMLEMEMARKVQMLEETISEADVTYEPNFKTWKGEQLETIKQNEVDQKRFIEKQDALISEQKTIVKEIETGINDLKEMSKETKKE